MKISIDPLKEQSDRAKIYKKNKTKLENIEIALIVNDIEKYNFDYKIAKEKVTSLTDNITKMLSTSSNTQALIENIKIKINTLNNNLYKSQEELIAISSKCEKLQGEKNLITERSKYDSNDIKLHDNIVSLKEKMLEIDNEISVANQELEILKKENEKKHNNYQKVLNDIKKEEDIRDKLGIDLNKLIKNITELKHKRDVLSLSIENNSLLPLGVKNILNNPKLIGIHNIVGKIIEYDEKYMNAIDVTLGGSSSFIICDTERNAREAVEYLKNNKKGRATFYPLNIIKPRFIDDNTLNIVLKEESFIDVASSLVKYDKKYDNIIKNLLGNTIIVKDLSSANRISKKINHKYKIVTLDGELVNIGGSITGGNLKNKNSIFSEKYELEEVIKLIEKTQKDINECENRINEEDLNYSNLDNKRKNILVNMNTNIDLIKTKEKNIEELLYRKNNYKKEVTDNENIINNVVTNEEEKLLNDYYASLKEKEIKEIEIESIKKELEEVKEELTSNESVLKVDNSEYTKLNNELKQNEILVNRLDVKLDNLLNSLSSDYSITYESAKLNYILDIDSEEARKEVNKLKNEIKSLGPINLGSIEEYERVSERYNFLNNQKKIY